MKCELVAVGTEILLGNILNTHARFLSAELAAVGIPVYYHTAVGDNKARLEETTALAFSRSDLVIFSGGLGPTTDDITAEVVCKVLGLEMQFDEKAWNEIKHFFDKLGRVPTENNKKQCYFPIGATVFYNEHGTAPGFAVTKDGKTAILLPGPPRELIPMFKEQALPYLAMESGVEFRSVNLMVYGIGESSLELMLADLVEGSDPTVALYAKDGQVQVRVTGAVDKRNPDDTKIEQTVSEIYKRTGFCCYGRDVEHLEQVVVPMLIEKGMTIATAESLTGGLIGKTITSVPGASAVYECGVVSYSNRIKHELLGVSEEDLERYGAVSAPVAYQMAKGVKRMSGADIAVAVTGFAGPGGGTEECPVGTVYLCVIAGERHITMRLSLHRGRAVDRELIRTLTVMKALDTVRRILLCDPQLQFDQENL